MVNQEIMSYTSRQGISSLAHQIISKIKAIAHQRIWSYLESNNSRSSHDLFPYYDYFKFPLHVKLPY